MTNDKKPKVGSDEHWELVRKKAEAIAEQLASASPADFDEAGLLSGGEKSLTSTDAEAFPEETEEYSPAERKPKLAKSSNKSDC
jgi:hypothetical protein